MSQTHFLQPSLWPELQPVRRTRNLTISTFNFAEDGYALLELEFLEARVIIAANTTIALKDIGLGRARKSSGQQVPFFAGAYAVESCMCRRELRGVETKSSSRCSSKSSSRGSSTFTVHAAVSPAVDVAVSCRCSLYSSLEYAGQQVRFFAGAWSLRAVCLLTVGVCGGCSSEKKIIAAAWAALHEHTGEQVPLFAGTSINLGVTGRLTT